MTKLFKFPEWVDALEAGRSLNNMDKNCEWCGADNAETYRQDTKYIDEAENWKTHCKRCRNENEKHWADLWADFYSECL